MGKPEIVFILGLFCVALYGEKLDSVKVDRGTNIEECTKSCNLQYRDGIQVTFCGTDFSTYSTHFEAIDSWCYYDCGMMTYYAGSCGCPNDCFSQSRHGSCVNSTTSSNYCNCEKGWGGQDCSLPVEGNSCSYHGQFQSGSSDNVMGYCQCESGFTGIDCSSPTIFTETGDTSFANAPWGNILGENEKEYHGDDYEDAHPVFNISVLATIQITMKEDDLLTQLYAQNAQNASYVPITFTFNNGNIRNTIENVGMRLKGAWSRYDMKKGWSIKFNEFISGQKFYNMKKLEFKPGADSDDVHLKNILYTNFQRGMGVPTPRGSYALFYINTIFMGVYFMHEDVSESFLQSRYHNDNGQGNLYKMCASVYLRYEGNDTNYYQNVYKYYPNGFDKQYHYELASSDTNNNIWTDMIDFLYFGNITSDKDYETLINERFDIDMLIKGLVVETFLMGDDGLTAGQNYYLYHSNNKDTPLQWSVFNNDFDEEFYFDDDGNPIHDSNITTFSLKSFDDPLYNPFISRTLLIDKYYNQYIEDFSTFLDIVFSSKSKQQPTDRYGRLMQFLLPWINVDYMWRVSKGMTGESFVRDAENTMMHLSERYQDTFKQVQDLKMKLHIRN